MLSSKRSPALIYERRYYPEPEPPKVPQLVRPPAQQATAQQELQDRMFGRGADARLRGEPLSACPKLDWLSMRYWKEGWLDVDRNFGKEAVSRKTT